MVKFYIRVLLPILFTLNAANAQDLQNDSDSNYPVRQDKSQPLEQMQPDPSRSPRPSLEREEREKENFALPLPPKKRDRGPATFTPAPLPQQPLRIEVLLNKEGIRQGVNYNPPEGGFPPDANGSVGSTHFVQWVNSALAVFDKKTGQMVVNPLGKPEPFDGNILWRGFGGPCESENDGDPIVLFDKIAQRWVMSQFAKKGSRGYNYSQCIAISDGQDPIKSSYFRYEFGFNEFNDYPKFSIWPDAYYASFNMFKSDKGGFLGARLCAFERSKLLSGDKAKWDCIDLKDEAGKPVAGVLPADLDGYRLPSSDSPAYVVGFGSDQLRLWKLSVDWSITKPLRLQNPVLSMLDVTNFDPACDNWECVPQKDTDFRLGTLSDRLMYRLSYRNFENHESLLLTHTVSVNGGSGIRWYELRRQKSEKEFRVWQQQSFSPDNQYRWLGSVAMDKQGNILLVYNTSSVTTHPSLRYTARLASDPLNSMAQEGTLAEGKRSVGADRWGDYGSVSVDPIDDCTFWVTGQYLSGDNPPGMGLTAENSDNNSESGVAGPRTVTKPVGLTAPNVVSGYHWDTVVSSLRFNACH